MKKFIAILQEEVDLLNTLPQVVNYQMETHVGKVKERDTY